MGISFNHQIHMHRFFCVCQRSGKLSTLTFDSLMCLLWMTAVSGISMRVMMVSSQDRFSMRNSTSKVLTTLRTMALAFMATMRPITSTSECRREERLPGRGEEARDQVGVEVEVEEEGAEQPTCACRVEEVHLLPQQTVEQQMLQPSVEPGQGAHERPPTQSREQRAAKVRRFKSNRHPNLCRVFVKPALPSKRDQCQLSDAGTQTGLITLALEYVDHLPLVQWDESVACVRKSHSCGQTKIFQTRRPMRQNTARHLTLTDDPHEQEGEGCNDVQRVWLEVFQQPPKEFSRIGSALGLFPPPAAAEAHFPKETSQRRGHLHLQDGTEAWNPRPGRSLQEGAAAPHGGWKQAQERYKLPEDSPDLPVRQSGGD